MALPHTLPGLPIQIAPVLDELTAKAEAAFGPDLRSIVLFGGAAAGRVSSESDVNLVFVLGRFAPDAIERLRPILRRAHQAIRLEPSFLLETEVPAAVETFALRFANLLRQRRVIYGGDPFAAVSLSRATEIARLRQVLMSLALHLRERYVLGNFGDESAGLLIAEVANPLRSYAAALLELRQGGAPSPSEALPAITAHLPGADWPAVLRQLSEARHGRPLPPHTTGPLVLRLIDLVLAMHEQASVLV